HFSRLLREVGLLCAAIRFFPHHQNPNLPQTARDMGHPHDLLVQPSQTILESAPTISPCHGDSSATLAPDIFTSLLPVIITGIHGWVRRSGATFCLTCAKSCASATALWWPLTSSCRSTFIS